MKRSLGISTLSKNYAEFRNILVTAVILVSVAIVISTVILYLPSFNILQAIGFEPEYSWIIIVMIPFMAFRYLFTESIISSMNSKKLIMPLIIGSLIRFPVFFILVYFFNAPTLGTILGYFCMIIISSISFAVSSIYVFKGKVHAPRTYNFFETSKQVLRASLSSWIPHVLNILGYQLSIITTLSIAGAIEAGKYYLPLGILTVTLFIVIGVTRVTHSLIGSIKTKEEQAQFLSYTMKIAFLFTLPFAAPLMIYSYDYLRIIGEEFATASEALTILMISLPFVILSEIVYYFTYGTGNHRGVLYLGLVGNVPRIILYFLLPQILGINGTAIAWLGGSVIQAACSSHYLRIMGFFGLEYRKYLYITVVPVVTGFIISYFDINFLISTAIIYIFSIILYIRLRLFTERDLENLIYSSLSRKKAQRIYPVASSIMHLIKRKR